MRNRLHAIDDISDFALFPTRKELVAYHTISEDRSRDGRHETSLLLALRERCVSMQKYQLYEARREVKVREDETSSGIDEEVDEERLDRSKRERGDTDSGYSTSSMKEALPPQPLPPQVIAPSYQILSQELARCKAELAELRSLKGAPLKSVSRTIYRVRRSQPDRKHLKPITWDHWLDPPRWLYGDKDQRSLATFRRGQLLAATCGDILPHLPELRAR